MTLNFLDLGPVVSVVAKTIKDSIAEQAGYAEYVNKQTDYTSTFYIDTYRKLRALDSKLIKLNELQTFLKHYLDATALTSDTTADSDLLQLATDELRILQPKITALYGELFDETSKFQNVIMEIRAGAGGEEAALFASELYRMYSQYAVAQHWEVEITDREDSEQNGFKHIVLYIKGQDVYKKLQYESGVHRVQRVPATESSGRIHTSTVSVAILPEVEDVDIQINPEDIVMEAYRSSGPGGQSVNKTSSAVRLRHIPSGIIVTSQENRSQLKNRDSAMRLLKSRLFQAKEDAQNEKQSGLRRTQIGTADRSEKVRTYNFPQSRITDHRIKKSWFNITEVMNGKLDTMITDLLDLMPTAGNQPDSGDDDDEE